MSIVSWYPRRATRENQFATLPEGIYSGLKKLKQLYVHNSLPLSLTTVLSRISVLIDTVSVTDTTLMVSLAQEVNLHRHIL